MTARGGKNFPPAVLGLLQYIGDQGKPRKRTVARVENVGSGPSSSTVALRRHGRSAAANLSSAVGN